MQEAEAKLVRETFSSVVPYLVYSQEFRGLMEKVLGESPSVEAFVDKFKQMISGEADTTRRTDGQIFINELRHRLPK